jgi:hypothetical protein
MTTDNNSALGNFKSLRFPDNLGTDEVPAYIRFVPQKVIYGGTKGLNPAERPGLKYGAPTSALQSNVANSMGDVINQVKSQISDQVGGVIKSFASGAKESINAIGSIFKGTSFSQVTSSIGNVVSGSINLGAFKINIGTKTEPDVVKSLGSINLYLPEGLTTASSVQYSGVELKGSYASAADKALAGTKLDKQLFKDVGGNVVAEVLKDMAGPEAAAVVTMATGKTLNNFSFQVFNGVGHRSFSYAFKLVPKNERETEAIKQIADTFLFLMLPGRGKDSTTGVHFYEIPCQWLIEYNYLGSKMKYHLQPGPCFLTNVTVTYGQETQNHLYTDGAPMDVQIQLEFMEIEPMYRGNPSVADGAIQ